MGSPDFLSERAGFPADPLQIYECLEKGEDILIIQTSCLGKRWLRKTQMNQGLPWKGLSSPRVLLILSEGAGLSGRSTPKFMNV
jgi:hypothetical protein